MTKKELEKLWELWKKSTNKCYIHGLFFDEESKKEADKACDEFIDFFVDIERKYKKK